MGTAVGAVVENDEGVVGADAHHRGGVAAGAAGEDGGRGAGGSRHGGAVFGGGELALKLGDGGLVGFDLGGRDGGGAGVGEVLAERSEFVAQRALGLFAGDERGA